MTKKADTATATPRPMFSRLLNSVLISAKDDSPPFSAFSSRCLRFLREQAELRHEPAAAFLFQPAGHSLLDALLGQPPRRGARAAPELLRRDRYRRPFLRQGRHLDGHNTGRHRALLAEGDRVDLRRRHGLAHAPRRERQQMLAIGIGVAEAEGG